VIAGLRAWIAAGLSAIAISPAAACVAPLPHGREIRIETPNAAANIRGGWFLDVAVAGGPQHRVEVDTGSVGLAIAAAAIPAGATQVGSGSIHYSSSGKILGGKVYRVPISFAEVPNLRTVAIPILGVERITCDRVHHPECVVAPGEATRVGVLGIGFGRRGSGADLADVVHAREASVNPFLQVEAMVRGDVRRAYTIFPDHIVLGLAGVHAAGRWQVFGLTHAADGDWNPLAGCFGAGSYHVRCSAGTVLVDTGVGTTIFSVPNHASGAVAPGTPLSIRIAGPPKLSFAFTSSGSDCSSLALSCARWSQRTRYPIAVNTSRRLIQAADYRFDDVCGQVAFRRTPDRPFP
jgi:hypothetical protein